MKTITPFLWFDDRAEEAAQFYTSLFDNSRITEVTRYIVDTPGGRVGDVMTVSFELEGQPFTALNGGPMFTFTEAVSFEIPCASQAEVDRFWNAFADGGEESQCGWIKDRFGLSWQVVPSRFYELVRSPDDAAVSRMTRAMLGMRKLDIAALEAAFAGETEPSPQA
ncbi:VOC family protein [Rhodococcus sp. HNM0569]|uniref:VOC family protein n=1 Tax=Rhodococcus sp. HNM0569 TaxID=2716340 RepID=UPI00146BFD12|nr:VOC family protein [Rhodococcus sp. HNM0569]NLU84521.1 VOC family protein [Rhodococcus sp. HNM0569]